MNLESYRGCCRQGTDWLLQQLNADGSIGPVADDLYYYRVPWAFALVGEIEAASRALEWTKRNMLTPEGALEGVTPQGVFELKFGLQGASDGQLDSPRGVSVDGQGNIYVADTGNKRIQKFDSTGVYQGKWEHWGLNAQPFLRPVAVAVDSNGGFYVSDQSNSRISRYDTSGKYQNTFGGKGSSDGQFMSQLGIAVDRVDNVYVADVHNSRIQKFDASGNFLTKWGRQGFGDGEFNQPFRVAVNHESGNVYVSDGNHRVQKFDSSGRFIDKWNRFGNDWLVRPYGIGVGPVTGNSDTRPVWVTTFYDRLLQACVGG